jgi:hypothetical protein
MKSVTPGSNPVEIDVNSHGVSSDDVNSHDVDSHDVSSSEDRESSEKMVDELQSLLKQREDALEILENEKDLLVKEKILEETEIKVGFVKKFNCE